ncbi:unnamed protein product, partial [Callosobruchus maculatus]
INDCVSSKIFGIAWNQESDLFKIILPQDDLRLNVTKRHVLSSIAKLFDPLEFLGPIIMPAKLLMQKIWISKIGWDDKLPDDLGGIWEEFSQNVSIIKFIAIPRWVFLKNKLKRYKYRFCRTYEEISTVLSLIEALLNSRTLCEVSNDSLDLSCLTPAHFLIGDSMFSFPARDLSQ